MIHGEDGREDLEVRLSARGLLRKRRARRCSFLRKTEQEREGEGERKRERGNEREREKERKKERILLILLKLFHSQEDKEYFECQAGRIFFLNGWVRTLCSFLS